MPVTVTWEPLLLFDALKRSPRLAGTAVLFGAKEYATSSAIPRVVLVPTGGDFGKKDDQDNLAELPIALACHVYGKTYDALWLSICAFVQAVFDFGQSSNVSTKHVGVEWATGPEAYDTGKEGEAAIVTVTVQSAVENTPIPKTTGEGEVDAVNIARQ